MSDRLLITSGILLNFARTPFYMVNPHWPSATLMEYPGGEWRFQAMKTLVMIGSRKERRSMHTKIAHASKPHLAKQLGREIHIDKAKWEAMARGIMANAVMAKFSQNMRAREALLNTGNDLLFEHRPDPIWGDNMDGSGKNWLGLVLMDVREALRTLS